MPSFEYRVPVDEAMSWELHKETLNWALVDRAEQAAREKYGAAFDDTEVDTRITTEDAQFIVTFTWSDEPEGVKRIRVSFDIITRQAGTVELTLPLHADVQEFLNDHLDKHGENLVNQHMPAGAVVHNWDVQRGESTLEVDWWEDTPVDDTEEETAGCPST